MGCNMSSCWPGRTSPEAEEVGMRGVVLGELNRWKSSIEVLEREGRKEARKQKKNKKGGTDDAGSTPHPAYRAGLNRSYKDLKKMLFKSSSTSIPEEHEQANSINADDDYTTSATSREGSLSSQRTRRSDNLQSMTSGELMLSIDPAVIRRKLLNPANEKSRQETVDALKVVQTWQNNPHYNTIVSLAAKIFKVPHCGIAIIDRKRLWMKAVHGSRGRRSFEVPRETSFAAYMLLSEKKQVMVVEDTQEDGRFHDQMDTMKTKDRIRFFAAAPLYASNGYQIGALQITDTKPRKLDAGSFTLLVNLAEMIVRALEEDAFGEVVAPEDLPPPAEGMLQVMEAPSIHAGDSVLNVNLISDLANNKLQHSASAKKSPAEKLTLVRSMNILETGIMVCNAKSGGGVDVLFVNNIFTQLTGIPANMACSRDFWRLFNIPGQEVAKVNKRLKEAFAQQHTVELTGRVVEQPSASFQLSFKTAGANSLDQDMPPVGVPSFVEFSQKRNLCYFFVLVRKAKEVESHQLPVSAFEAAVGAEDWGQKEEDEEMEEVALDPTPSANGSIGQRKASVTLPYNDTLFSEVVLGPLLGRGSFGKVHRGAWNSKQIAVKIIENFRKCPLGEEVDDLTEAALMESMQHPNVMQTYKHATRAKFPANMTMKMDFGGHIDDSQMGHILETWLLLEYCNKGSLQDANDRGWFRTEPSRAKGKPDMSIILPTALEMARGLDYLHGKGVLHGDLSPGNVLLSDKPEAPHGFTVKVADFGLSRQTASKTIKTQTFGTVTHMPPELLMDGKLTKAADVYAFGVLLWGMFTGLPPWQGMRRTQVMFKVTALGASLQIPANCPLFYKDLLERCMRRDHKERPTFADLVRELSILAEAQQAGLDLHAYSHAAPPAVSRSTRSISLSRPALPEVAESEPLSGEEMTKTSSPNSGFKKIPSLQRRPSFSHRVQLEVV